MIPQRNLSLPLIDSHENTSNQHVDITELIEAVEEKLEFRGKSLTDVREEFLRKESRFKKLWKIRLSYQMASIPEFGQVYRVVQRKFRQAGLLKQRKI